MDRSDWGWKRIFITVVVTVLFIIFTISIFGPLVLIIIGSSPDHPIAALSVIFGTTAIVVFFIYILPWLSQMAPGKFTKKVLVYLLLTLMLILFILGSAHGLPHWLSGICGLSASFILMFLLIWAGYAFSKSGSYIIDRYPVEFDQMAETFNRTADGAIAKMLGIEACRKLYPGDGFLPKDDAYFQECAQRSTAKTEEELRFYMIAKKAHFEALKENFDQAEEFLREALAIDKNSFLLWLRLAEVNERQGNGPGAVAAYESASALAPDNSKVKEYLDAQIRRVQTQGPMKQLPIQGITYGSV